MTCPKRDKGIAPTPLSTRVIPYRFATIALLALFFLASGASAQSLIDDEATGPTYRVGAIEIEFANSHPDNPSIEALLPVEVTLRKTASGWSQPIEGNPAETLQFSSMSPTRSLDATAVVSLLSAIVNQLHEAGFYGVDVRPAASDFDLANERDFAPQIATPFLSKFVSAAFHRSEPSPEVTASKAIGRSTMRSTQASEPALPSNPPGAAIKGPRTFSIGAPSKTTSTA